MMKQMYKDYNSMSYDSIDKGPAGGKKDRVKRQKAKKLTPEEEEAFQVTCPNL